MLVFFELYLTLAVSALLSVLGCSFIIAIYFKFPDLKCFAFRIILFLSLFDGLEAFFLIIPAPIISPYLCTLQALTNQFFGLCSILWTGCISIIVYIQALDITTDPEKLEKKFLTFVAVFSLLTSICILIFDEYGLIGGNCWILDDGIGKFFRFGFFFIPAWVVIIVISVLYTKIAREIYRSASFNSELREIKQKLIKKLMFYALVMIVCFTPMTLYRVLQFYDEPLWFYCFSLAFYNLRGLINAVVYGLNENVRNKMRMNLQDGSTNSFISPKSFTF